MIRGRRWSASFAVVALVAWLLTVVPLVVLVRGPSAASPGGPPAGRPAYPPAPRQPVIDDYHGSRVSDPYRWLESLDAPQTLQWMTAQDALSTRWLGALPTRRDFAARLRRLHDHERIGVPQVERGIWAWRYNPGQAEQDAIHAGRDPAGPGTAVIDPRHFDADGTHSVADFQLSRDGRLIAYARSDGGSDWNTWRVRRVADGHELDDVIAGTKFTRISWSADGQGFYYSAYPQHADGSHDDTRPVRLYHHRLGAPQVEDREVYTVTDHPTREPYAELTRDGRWLVITLSDGFEANAVHVMPVDRRGGEGAVLRVFDDWDARYEFLGSRRGMLYFLTTREAPRGRIVAVDPRRPKSLRTVVPQSGLVINAAVMAGTRFVVSHVRDAASELYVYGQFGEIGFEVGLPGKGTVGGLARGAVDHEVLFTWTDFTTPRTVYRLDVRNNALAPLREPRHGVDRARYMTEQVFYASADGTRVPMYIVRRRDVVLNGRRPTVLYGYGGFNVSLLPSWSAGRMAWIEAGGIYAQANLRGGGEYGEAWHQAGTRGNKQNVYDDFIAAAEWLHTNGYSNRRRLAVWGGSNGGLLVGAVINQRPELFAAAVPAVGVMDLLRYHTASLNARKWASDYGLSENPEEFPALRAGSPYHNLRDGLCYPATLVLADAQDDRVVPWHSYKYAAALQHAQGCDRPVLIRIETRSGHGAGASLSKVVSEYADQWAFLAHVLRLEPLPAGAPP